jgi:hypothetical protein
VNQVLNHLKVLLVVEIFIVAFTFTFYSFVLVGVRPSRVWLSDAEDQSQDEK